MFCAADADIDGFQPAGPDPAGPDEVGTLLMRA